MITTESAERLRRRMADQLVAEGTLRSTEWHAAFAAVPRELFVPEFTVRTAGGALTTYRMSDPGYLEAVYADVSLLTRHDAHGTTTSSSTRPTMMALMLEALAPNEGRVLEVGTGTGYNAAVLSHRYGSRRIVSLDIDPSLVGAARTRLAAAGYTPTLTVGDGTRECPEHAPFAGLIATCGIGRIPQAWSAQVRPGGSIVANLGCGLVALTVGDDHSAAGRFLPTLAAFMTARSNRTIVAAPARSHAGQLMTAVGPSREIDLPVDLTADMPRFLGSLVQPDVVELTLIDDNDRQVHGLTHAASGSWARITPREDGSARLEAGGPRALWDERAPLLRHWAGAGTPGADAYTLSVHSNGRHSLQLDDGTRWALSA
ncbi:methyltransferase domain-containing protein [Streptomyces sp. LX-29]|uniref:methyltransferase domain-containing protein n=1 Tax=Streptomyces sp. LX-29 TaxID=2900152 RepID=UPI00240DC20C|nr:methyltransferase domain-containing protein [Streptomyces sp. LX-29]WFB06422.1 methyltransferase domain-containing protein [Streptomyces sp. LX-29]